MKKIILMAVLLAVSVGVQAGCYSEGVRVGVIQKFSLKGYINKSWEGEMVQEGDRVRSAGHGAAATNIWRFSVLDASIAKQVDDAAFAGGVVALRYCQNASVNYSGRADTEYLVTAVAPRSAK